MKKKIKLNPAIRADGKGFLKNLAYDSVIFGFSDGQLKILLMEYHNTGLFALPGGFIQEDEDLNEAVKEGLKERTGLDDIFLEQYYAFGDRRRFDASVLKKILLANGIKPDPDHWMLGRFVTVAYYALINYKNVQPKPDVLSDSCTWYSLNELPLLILDHKEIVEKALNTLRHNLDRKVVGGNLLPQKFTMNELQKVYESILGQELRRSTFQRKMLGMKILRRHQKQFSGKAHKAPYLYSFLKR
ncbi:NUDIX hydrolase [Pollutibacter soli]|uniref:NUDIX hydrolase n=1 Tax=Pollutibacter soli TaxID=3034157 RepID=UPI003013A060